MTPENYLASKQIILPIPQGIVELVSMKDALKAVKMARGENVGRVEPMKGIPRIQVKDLSDMTEEAKENCSYMSRNLERKCSFQETTMYGWKLGYKDAIDKACEWVEKFAYNSIVTDNIGEMEKQAIVTSFKENMEEQQ